MGRVRLLPIGLVTIPLTLFATQPSSSLTGRWIAVEPDKIAGHELVVTQDATTLRLDQLRLQPRQTYDEFGRPGAEKGERESTAYRLDGQVLVTSRGGQSVRSSLREDKGRLLLRDQILPPGVTFERMLSLDSQGRLVLEHRRSAVTDDAAQASESILDVRRIVFERR
jgi:hypothetical protein